MGRKRAWRPHLNERPLLGSCKRTLDGGTWRIAAIHIAYTRRDCFTAASMKLANSGCGSKGLLFSSGWNWTPTNQG